MTSNSDTVMLEVLKLLKEIKDGSDITNNSIKQKRNRSDGNDNQNNNSNHQNNNNSNRRNPKRRNNDSNNRATKRVRKPVCYDVSKYCHSCGAGNHDSSQCNKKKQGHKNQATFKKMLGGSTDFCQVCT